MERYNTKYLARAGIIAAVYVVLTLVMGNLGYGPVQFRASEALVMLPLIESAAIPGVFVGCILSNIFGGYGIIDIIFGSLVTLLAAYLTSKMPNRLLAAVPPIVLNALIVPIWVSKMANWPYWPTVLNFALSEAAAVLVLGNILLFAIEKVEKRNMKR